MRRLGGGDAARAVCAGGEKEGVGFGVGGERVRVAGWPWPALGRLMLDDAGEVSC